MKFTMTDNPKEQDIQEILNHLREYNLSRIECKLVKPIAIFVTDENGSKIGELPAKHMVIGSKSIIYGWMRKQEGQGLAQN